MKYELLFICVHMEMSKYKIDNQKTKTKRENVLNNKFHENNDQLISIIGMEIKYLCQEDVTAVELGFNINKGKICEKLNINKKKVDRKIYFQRN